MCGITRILHCIFVTCLRGTRLMEVYAKKYMPGNACKEVHVSKYMRGSIQRNHLISEQGEQILLSTNF